MQTEFDTLHNMCEYYSRNMLEGETLSETMIIHGESLPVHIYRVSDKHNIYNVNQDVTNLFTLCKSVDTAMQVVIGKNIIVNSGVTFTPPYRCKGLVIYDFGTTINNGKISMTSRGCVAKGQDIYLYKNLETNQYEYVPAVGAAGGASRRVYEEYGNNGANGIGRQTGGGGTGGGRIWGGYNTTVGRGGYGTSFSGGSGSGAANSDGGGGWVVASANAPDNGGAGTDGVTSASNSSGYSIISMGGQGNPQGGYSSYRASPSASQIYTDVYGTGGLLIMFCGSIFNSGSIQSHGGNTMFANLSPSNRSSGGASGGGSVNVFYSGELTNNGTITATGGQRYGTATHHGGLGGNGCVTTMQIGQGIVVKRCSTNKYHIIPGDTVTITVRRKILEIDGYKQEFTGLRSDYDKIKFTRISSSKFTFVVPLDVVQDLGGYGGSITIEAVFTKLRTNSNLYRDSFIQDNFEYTKIVGDNNGGI